LSTQDQKKGRLSGVFFALSFFFPVISLIAGWIGWGWRVGVISGLVTFALFFLLGLIFAASTQAPSWFTIMLPTIVGLGYGLFNFIPLAFDDALVATAGVIISFALAIRQYTDMPKWILVPLLAGAVYTVVGKLIPGPVDELIVGFISIGVPALEVIKHQQALKKQEMLPEKKENF